MDCSWHYGSICTHFYIESSGTKRCTLMVRYGRSRSSKSLPWQSKARMWFLSKCPTTVTSARWAEAEVHWHLGPYSSGHHRRSHWSVANNTSEMLRCKVGNLRFRRFLLSLVWTPGIRNSVSKTTVLGLPKVKPLDPAVICLHVVLADRRTNGRRR